MFNYIVGIKWQYLKPFNSVNTNEKRRIELLVLNLVWFYGISTIVAYLMPNPVFTYVLNILFVD